ncbi:MAG TPA: helicase associated domain-containing protein [Arthrobacter sp.]
MTQKQSSSRPSHEDAWAAKAAELAEFHARQGRFPNSKDGSIYSWIIIQRRLASPGRAAALDSRLPGWRGVKHFAGQWEAALDRAEAFVAANGRLPRHKAADTDERSLGNWINVQRYAITPEREAILDRSIPSWRTYQAMRPWEDSLGAVADFANVTGDFPHQTSADAETRRLAHWLKDQRMGCSPERSAALDESVPGWRGKHPGHRSWDQSLAGVAAFFAVEGHLPLAPRTAGPEEKRLRGWLTDQKLRASAGQRARLDALFPGWAEPLYSWDERFESVKAFHAANGRLPRPNDTGDARVLGKWVSSQRQTESERIRAAFDAEFPGWCRTLEEQWSTALDSLTAVVASSGRLPNPKTDDASGASGRWLQKQRKHATAERVKRLDAAVPGWRGTPRKRLAA